MAHVEQKHWWYRGLRDLVTFTLKSLVKHNPTILDAGCGTGENISVIQSYLPGATVIGIDNSTIAISYAKRKGLGYIAHGTINSMPIADSSVDAIISLDVLYHKDIDEESTLKEFVRILKPSGVLIMNLPAFEWLRTQHDIQIQTSHRYTTTDVRNKTYKAGFNVINCYYRNSLLFPFMIINRLIKKLPLKYTNKSSVNLPYAPINYIFSSILRLENKLIRMGIRFPAGGSVFCLLKPNGIKQTS
tara:strand:- start:587 stop:1321 length:735 start_codon:yes stop_codon:yes gene_type:complete